MPHRMAADLALAYIRAQARISGADPGDLHRLRRIAFNDFAILLEAFGTAGDEDLSYRSLQ